MEFITYVSMFFHGAACVPCWWTKHTFKFSNGPIAVLEKDACHHSFQLGFWKRFKAMSCVKKYSRGRPRWKQTLNQVAQTLCQKKIQQQQKTDNGDLTTDTWHVTYDTWRGLTILLKFQLTSSYGLGVLLFWRFQGKGSANWLITKVFVEQPRLHWVC